MRARSIKPGTFKNELLGSADPLLTILFEGLWCMADREGRLEDRPLRICAELFPYRRKLTERRIDEMLWWLDEHGFIARFEISSKQYIEVLEFSKHQNPHKSERPSEIQPFRPNLHRARTVESRKSHSRLTEAAGLTPSSLTPDSGLLTPDSPNPVLPPESEPVQKPASEEGRDPDIGELPDDVVREEVQRIKTTYPTGTYRKSDWLTAEREIRKRAEEGVGWDEMLAGVERYARQVNACGWKGTQFVRTPTNFFRDRDYTEPFPLPATKAEAKRDANIDASLTWLAEQEAKDAAG